MEQKDTLFLPDFCAINLVFAVVLVGELLAFVLVLTPTGDVANFWYDLALVSLFTQWVALSSAGLLCLLRPRLRAMNNVPAGLVGYGLILLVTLVLTEITFWLVAEQIIQVDFSTAWKLDETGQWFDQPSRVDVPLTTRWHVEFLLRSLGISAIVSAVALRYFYVQHQWKSNLESESRARIQALQSRIRPHFLFNSMNTIASLTRTEPALAEQITEDLADLFRVSLGDASVAASLREELVLCEQYLRIEQHRLGERLTLIWDTDALPGDALVPRLILQPLLENAVYHGIEPAAEVGVISLRGECVGDLVRIRIANSLAGSGDSTSDQEPRQGNQLAQDNVRQRLGAFFGSRASLAMGSLAGADQIGQSAKAKAAPQYQVVLEFPYLTTQS